MKKLITILFLLVQLGYGQFSGDYNIGTGETYTTLKSFCDAVNAGTVTGNITAYITTDLTEAANVGLGVNTNGFSITIKPSADENRTITFTQLADNTSPTGHFVIGYLGTGLSVAWADANTIATSNVTIDGYATGGSTRRLTFTNTSAAHVGARVIVVIGACENTIIKNCIINNLTTHTGSPFCVGAVIRQSAAIDVAPINLTFENNILTANGNNVAMGSRLTNSGTPTSRITGFVFKDNIVTARRRLLEINYTTGGEIYNNEFRTQQTGAPGTVSYGLWTSVGVTGTINIYNNKFVEAYTEETSGNGHRVVSLSSGATYNIYNNIFAGLDKTKASTTVTNLTYLFYSGVAGTIYNNTFYMPALTNASSTGYYNCIQVSGNSAEIKNNIFISDEATHTNPSFISAVPTPASDYNVFYMRQTNVNHKVVATYTSLSAYQTANPTKDVNSVSKDVNFVSATDLHLTGQSVGDYDLAGTPIDGYTTDIDGQTRSTTFPYMGADENTDVVLAESYKRPVDGVAADWTGTPSGTLHATVVSTEEAIYTGESGDSRTDQHGGAAGEDANNDITEFRFTRDQSYIYFMVKLRDITTLDRPYIAVGIDANQNDASPNWLGDDSGVLLVPATNRAWERQLTVHATTSGNLGIEMFADDGSEWYAPLSNYQVSGSMDNNVIEFRVALHDLGITSSTTLNLAVATFNNEVGYNNSVNATTGSFIDVVTPGYSGSNNAWFRAGESNTDLNANVSWNQSLSPLPVELTSLNANVFGKDVKLGWSTATEVNSYQFVVERNSNEVWNTVGTVNATGNSNSPKEYSFTDNSLQHGKYLYRLKMVDNDGSFEYSQTVEVDIDVPKEFTLMQNYPNPFNPVTNINYTIPVDSKVMLIIYSINGEKVAELVNETQASGSYSIPFNASHLASGTYIYRLIANDFVQTKKMLLIK